MISPSHLIVILSFVLTSFFDFYNDFDFPVFEHLAVLLGSHVVKVAVVTVIHS